MVAQNFYLDFTLYEADVKEFFCNRLFLSAMLANRAVKLLAIKKQ